jgi:hypothetical protein
MSLLTNLGKQIRCRTIGGSADRAALLAERGRVPVENTHFFSSDLQIRDSLGQILHGVLNLMIEAVDQTPGSRRSFASPGLY